MRDPDRDLSPFYIDKLPCHPFGIDELIDELRILRADPSLRPRSIACLNAHIVNIARSKAQLRADFEAIRVVTADGMSVVWFGRWLGGDFQERCNMTDALMAFMKAPDFPQSSAIVVGGTAEQAKAAGKRLEADCPHLCVLGFVDGFLDNEAILAAIERLPPTDFIFVGLGTPRSERMLVLLDEAFSERIAWHIGGGTILHLAGAVKRAPAWMRRSGLQWAHRLLMEPRRMWRRYLVGNTRFIWAMIDQKIDQDQDE